MLLKKWQSCYLFLVELSKHEYALELLLYKNYFLQTSSCKKQVRVQIMEKSILIIGMGGWGVGGICSNVKFCQLNIFSIEGQ